ncbi:hypothetical protein GOB94_00215 [Granulicella sp. 5B5]|uniref:hypothetical protein n=1 Tax=Granulicella sp. 5B5 TaxID=1617967 RepID=UPI0015F55C62|nr:hypothetical protein [Granulicella sp. 5B5]QMV17306.1 hypothetical protein GOB94_00215 [Granulicella sp. 5B5]
MSLIKRYIFWTYQRGSFHYDVMVTLILLFLFVSPRFIDFKAKPVPEVPLRASEVLVKEQGSTATEARFVYEIPVGELHGAAGDAAIRSAILNVVEPIAGSVTLESYTAVSDSKGHVTAYDAAIRRENP